MDAIQLAGTVPCVFLREEGKQQNLFVWPNVKCFMRKIFMKRSQMPFIFFLSPVLLRVIESPDENQNVNNEHACALNTSSIRCMGGSTHEHFVVRLSDCSMFIWRSERVACRHFINCCAAVAEVKIVCAHRSCIDMYAHACSPNRIHANSHRLRQTRENNKMPTRNWLKMQLCSRTRTSHSHHVHNCYYVRLFNFIYSTEWIEKSSEYSMVGGDGDHHGTIVANDMPKMCTNETNREGKKFDLTQAMSIRSEIIYDFSVAHWRPTYTFLKCVSSTRRVRINIKCVCSSLSISDCGPGCGHVSPSHASRTSNDKISTMKNRKQRETIESLVISINCFSVNGLGFDVAQAYHELCCVSINFDYGDAQI